ncbi:hypothetical protein VUR80DRAFT_1572 [Thermomyces stellatus]
MINFNHMVSKSMRVLTHIRAILFGFMLAIQLIRKGAYSNNTLRLCTNVGYAPGLTGSYHKHGRTWTVMELKRISLSETAGYGAKVSTM